MNRLGAATSLLLCAVAVAFWARSYVLVDDVGCWTWWHGGGIVSIRGRMICWQATARPPGGVAVATGCYWTHSVKPSAALPQPVGPFYWPRGEIGFGTRRDPRFVAHELYLPHAAIVLLLALWPIRWALVRRRATPQEGFCPACGYDLRASPDRCPECGKPIPTRGPKADPEENAKSVSFVSWDPIQHRIKSRPGLRLSIRPGRSDARHAPVCLTPCLTPAAAAGQRFSKGSGGNSVVP